MPEADLYIWLLELSEAWVFNLRNGYNNLYFQSYENGANVGQGSTTAHTEYGALLIDLSCIQQPANKGSDLQVGWMPDTSLRGWQKRYHNYCHNYKPQVIGSL